MDKKTLIELILNEVKLVGEENGVDFSRLNSETVLFGSGSALDSLALVGLIVNLEEKIAQKTGKNIQIVSEDMIILDDETPLRNAELMSQLILSLLSFEK